MHLQSPGFNLLNENKWGESRRRSRRRKRRRERRKRRKRSSSSKQAVLFPSFLLNCRHSTYAQCWPFCQLCVLQETSIYIKKYHQLPGSAVSVFPPALLWGFVLFDVFFCWPVAICFLCLIEETHTWYGYVSMCVKMIETRELQYFIQSYVSNDLTSIRHNLLNVLLPANHSRDWSPGLLTTYCSGCPLKPYLSLFKQLGVRESKYGFVQFMLLPIQNLM